MACRSHATHHGEYVTHFTPYRVGHVLHKMVSRFTHNTPWSVDHILRKLQTLHTMACRLPTHTMASPTTHQYRHYIHYTTCRVGHPLHTMEWRFTHYTPWLVSSPTTHHGMYVHTRFTHATHQACKLTHATHPLCKFTLGTHLACRFTLATHPSHTPARPDQLST